MNSNKKSNNTIMTAKYIQVYNQDKQDVTKKIDSMSYERALRYIDREINDFKAIRKTKTNKAFIAESVRQLKQKQKEINKKIYNKRTLKLIIFLMKTNN